ncbi:hypothetical protein LTR27_009604 [Elasticomyces elasticus]|nr:hypothetical protein LTR27_009604 [Elasticomyces elasticus]
MPHSECTSPGALTSEKSTTSASLGNTVYLVTGANTAVRDLSRTEDLQALECEDKSRLIIVKIDGNVDLDASHAVSGLQSSHGIDHIDTVVANAGIESWFGPTTIILLSRLRSHFEINALAPLALFLGTWPLLQRSGDSKFVPISSRLGSISKVKNTAAADLAC